MWGIVNCNSIKNILLVLKADSEPRALVLHLISREIRKMFGTPPGEMTSKIDRRHPRTVEVDHPNIAFDSVLLMNISAALLIDHLSPFSLLACHFFAFREKLKFLALLSSESSMNRIDLELGSRRNTKSRSGSRKNNWNLSELQKRRRKVETLIKVS